MNSIIRSIDLAKENFFSLFPTQLDEKTKMVSVLALNALFHGTFIYLNSYSGVKITLLTTFSIVLLTPTLFGNLPLRAVKNIIQTELIFIATTLANAGVLGSIWASHSLLSPGSLNHFHFLLSVWVITASTGYIIPYAIKLLKQALSPDLENKFALLKEFYQEEKPFLFFYSLNPLRNYLDLDITFSKENKSIFYTFISQLETLNVSIDALKLDDKEYGKIQISEVIIRTIAQSKIYFNFLDERTKKLALIDLLECISKIIPHNAPSSSFDLYLKDPEIQTFLLERKNQFLLRLPDVDLFAQQISEWQDLLKQWNVTPIEKDSLLFEEKNFEQAISEIIKVKKQIESLKKENQILTLIASYFENLKSSIDDSFFTDYLSSYNRMEVHCKKLQSLYDAILCESSGLAAQISKMNHLAILNEEEFSVIEFLGGHHCFFISKDFEDLQKELNVSDFFEIEPALVRMDLRTAADFTRHDLLPAELITTPTNEKKTFSEISAETIRHKEKIKEKLISFIRANNHINFQTNLCNIKKKLNSCFLENKHINFQTKIYKKTSNFIKDIIPSKVIYHTINILFIAFAFKNTYSVFGGLILGFTHHVVNWTLRKSDREYLKKISQLEIFFLKPFLRRLYYFEKRDHDDLQHFCSGDLSVRIKVIFSQTCKPLLYYFSKHHDGLSMPSDHRFFSPQYIAIRSILFSLAQGYSLGTELGESLGY